jgi:type I restriction enzyme S subunit
MARSISDCLNRKAGAAWIVLAAFGSAHSFTSQDRRRLLDEQRRIAAILDQADNLRHRRRRTLERLEILSTAMFREFVQEIEGHDYPTVSLRDAVELITVGHVGPTSEFFRERGSFLKNRQHRKN